MECGISSALRGFGDIVGAWADDHVLHRHAGLVKIGGRKRVPSGKLTFCHGKIHHAINGKTHYFYGPFSIAM